MTENKIFVDSNIILYLFNNDQVRKALAASLFLKNFYASTQVVNENVNVCLRKLKLPKAEAFKHGQNILNGFQIATIHKSTIELAFELATGYGFSYWDSLIVACALESKCNILLSEDMQDGLNVKGILSIINPFNNLDFFPQIQ